MFAFLLGLHSTTSLLRNQPQDDWKTPVIIFTGTIRPPEADSLLNLDPKELRRKARKLNYAVSDGRRTITLIPPSLQCPPEMIPVALVDQGYPMRGYIWNLSDMPPEVREGVRAYFDEEVSVPNRPRKDIGFDIVVDAGLKVHYRTPKDRLVREVGLRLSCIRDKSLVQDTRDVTDMYVNAYSSSAVTKFLASSGEGLEPKVLTDAHETYMRWLKARWKELDRTFTIKMKDAIRNDPLFRKFPTKVPPRLQDFPPIISWLVSTGYSRHDLDAKYFSKSAKVVEAYWEFSLRPAVQENGNFTMAPRNWILRRIPYEDLMAP